MSSPGDSRRARVRAKWTPPEGPLPYGDGGDPSLAPREGESLDMLSGEWRVFQRKDGHRWSTDDLLCAWLGCRRAEDRAVQVARAIDLGAGIGSIAMMVAWKHPRARVDAVEAQDVSADLFARSIRYNGAADRITLQRGDLRDESLVVDLGAYDLVTGSPPYFDEADGVVSDRPQRGPCRFEQRGGVEAYTNVATRALAPNGVFALVHTWAARDRVHAAAESARLAVVSSTPIAFRADRAPHLGLYEMAHAGARAVEGESAPIVIRERDGARTRAYSEMREWMGFPP